MKKLIFIALAAVFILSSGFSSDETLTNVSSVKVHNLSTNEQFEVLFESKEDLLSYLENDSYVSSMIVDAADQCSVTLSAGVDSTYISFTMSGDCEGLGRRAAARFAEMQAELAEESTSLWEDFSDWWGSW